MRSSSAELGVKSPEEDSLTSKNRNAFPTWKTITRFDDGGKVVLDPLLSENAYVYHYLPWPFGKTIFQRNELRLSQVNSWQDPYEAAWCRLLFEGENGLNGVNAYGLCWTTSRFDEPFWRMVGFNKGHVIVRIRCKVGDILQAGSNLIENETGSLYLGKVDYMQQKRLYNLADRTLKNEFKDVSSTASGLLLKKRNAFRFENEVRLIWLDRAKKKEALFIPIEPTKIISQVLISPHATNIESDTIKKECTLLGVKALKSGILKLPRHPALSSK